ncbi:hypothetical protein SeMB42_g02983 [Synchytrium endobioticum]|uniref:Histone H1 n=1 Tax=Synchytrium endobioticum TaxID=286115 RepID=A0A507DCA1_9FUNG|nr:hypothetical protein SeMB42_g02981 [Synchytrium endobioticum]TPX48492.1 hypothetical protein SeMB42_g02983 [Synchytrium endobioticum]TPX49025.1 hypothetical protein SeLEV6574_g01708 [Synchytrium endobioticum]
MTLTKAFSSKKQVAEHPPFKKMVEEAIIALNERNGSSRQAVKKYVLANYTVKNDATTSSNINAAIRKGVGEGVFAQPKGSSGPIKLVMKETVRPSSVASRKKASSTKDVKTPAISSKAAEVSENTPVGVEVHTPELVAGEKSATKPRSTRSTKTIKPTPKKAASKKAVAVAKKATPAKSTAGPLNQSLLATVPRGTRRTKLSQDGGPPATAASVNQSLQSTVARVTRRTKLNQDEEPSPTVETKIEEQASAPYERAERTDKALPTTTKRGRTKRAASKPSASPKKATLAKSTNRITKKTPMTKKTKSTKK